jgi:hypothetical protein
VAGLLRCQRDTIVSVFDGCVGAANKGGAPSPPLSPSCLSGIRVGGDLALLCAKTRSPLLPGHRLGKHSRKAKQSKKQNSRYPHAKAHRLDLGGERGLFPRTV